MKFTYTHNSFSNGELNPRLMGRTDIKEYFNSAKEVKGFLVENNGTVNEVSGSNFLYEPTDGQKPILTITRNPFRGTSYIPEIEWNDPVTWTVFLGDTSSVVLYHSAITITRTKQNGDTTSWSVTGGSATLSRDSFIYGTYIVINDTIFITDKRGINPPLVIYTQIGNGSWIINDFTTWCSQINTAIATTDLREFYSSPFTEFNTDTSFILAVSAGTTITATEAIFSDGMIGSHIEIYTGAASRLVKITGYTNPFVITFTAVGTLVANGNYSIFRRSIWYTNNYPKVVSTFQERLIFSNSSNRENYMFMSEAGNLAIFTKTKEETPSDIPPSYPFDLPLYSIDSSPIYWVLSERYLSVGTGTEEFIVNGTDGIFGPANRSAISTSKYGSHDIGLAVRAQSSSYFVVKGGGELRELSFSEENGGYLSRSLSVLGPEMININRVEYDYKNKRLYLEQVGGSLLSCTVDNSSKVVAWSDLVLEEYVVGFGASEEVIKWNGKYLIGQVENTVRPVSGVQPSTYIEHERIRAVVGDDEGVIGGVPSYYVRVPASYLDLEVGQEIMFVDQSGVRIVPSITATGGGDYYVHVPSAGSDFARAVYKTRPFNSRIVTTPIQQGSKIGDSQIALQRVDLVLVRYYMSYGSPHVGLSETSLEREDITGPFTGVKKYTPAGTPEIDHSVLIENRSDRPVSILSISCRGLGEEG